MLALALALTLASSSASEDRRRWTATDTALEASLVLVLTVDWMQTRTDVAPRCWELNPLLGRCPSPFAVDIYFAGLVVLHVAVAILLPHPWRTLWQVLLLLKETITITRNHVLGIRVRW
jgi:hypothetical protein